MHGLGYVTASDMVRRLLVSVKLVLRHRWRGQTAAGIRDGTGEVPKSADGGRQASCPARTLTGWFDPCVSQSLHLTVLESWCMLEPTTEDQWN